MREAEHQRRDTSGLGVGAAWLAAFASAVAAIVAWNSNNAHFTDRQDEIRSSRYNLTVSDDMLIMSAPDGTAVPTSVSVKPIFLTPGQRLDEAIGEAAPQYEGLQAFPHIDGMAVRIPAVVEDVCDVVENQSRCREFEIARFQVSYSFGRYGAIVDYASVQ